MSQDCFFTSKLFIEGDGGIFFGVMRKRIGSREYEDNNHYTKMWRVWLSQIPQAISTSFLR